MSSFHKNLLDFTVDNVGESEKLALGNNKNAYDIEKYEKVSPAIPPKPLKKKSIDIGGGNELDRQRNRYPVQKTLDNPDILEQQLEALAHRKKQMDKKRLLQQRQTEDDKSYTQQIPKLSSMSLIYTNIPKANTVRNEFSTAATTAPDTFDSFQADDKAKHENSFYSNLLMDRKGDSPVLSSRLLPSTPTPTSFHHIHEDIPHSASPVSSSYSELRRTNDIDLIKPNIVKASPFLNNAFNIDYNELIEDRNIYANMQQNYSSLNSNAKDHAGDYYGFASLSQSSSTYESIYEPINPRPSSQMSNPSKYLSYSQYANISQLSENSNQLLGGNTRNLEASDLSTTPCAEISNSADIASQYRIQNAAPNQNRKEDDDVEALTDFFVQSLGPEVESYGVCFKCNKKVLGENSGCTAMNQIYHIGCFTCSQCQINLQGKPFYALEGKPYCEYDYLQTLEKCSVCQSPILERILRATGKPYHPQCFTCIMCGKSLDGVQFTVDATNQNYCIADFHKKFAPRCCVCKEPIMPEPGQEETVRVVALDRSFHFKCYKCEDCGLLLSSEAEGRGCYPLDDHVLCKSCNAKRVQMLTNKMTSTEL